MISKSVFASFFTLLVLAAKAGAALTAADVPTFEARLRVVSVDGVAPVAAASFLVHSFTGVKDNVTVHGSEWSAPLVFDVAAAAAAITKYYPNLYLKRFPVVVKLSVRPASASTVIEFQIHWTKPADPQAAAADPMAVTTPAESLDETVFPAPDLTLGADLFGEEFGFLVWRDDEGRPQAASMADYNQRYWAELADVPPSVEARPRHFPIIDRFIGGSADRREWQEGIANLARAGFTALMLPPSRLQREMAQANGLQRTAWAVYSPPGYAFDHAPEVTPSALADWGRKQAQPYLDAGYDPHQIALYAMSDEPGWYFPSQLQRLTENPEALTRFRAYLRQQGLAAADVGQGDWDTVSPIGRSQVRDLPTRRLFYWSARFFAWDSARHFAHSTEALEQAFYPDLPIITNWNFFSGRFYFPGAFGNNPDKDSPDSAMGGHDWFEYARMRGSTMLWTEDWFGDSRAPQWSFYCAKLASAARYRQLSFGGYVIPRTSGDRDGGLVQKVLTIVGMGGKAIKYFVFGPEYNFPGNCYSMRRGLLRQMAEAHGMIAAAESVLWPGRRPPASVAILQPRSSLVWDHLEAAPDSTEIIDATNTAPEKQTVDYLAEVYGLYLALQHANIPTDWVDEDDLAAAGAAPPPWRVLYVTEPDLPQTSQQGLIDWVEQGGTLVTVTGAGSGDRYGQPSTLLAAATGIGESPRQRLLVPHIDQLAVAAAGAGDAGQVKALGARGTLLPGDYEVVAKFDDGSPAVVSRQVGLGRALHFAWLPGIAYAASHTAQLDGMPVGYDADLRRWILQPLASVTPPVRVDQLLVETPLLRSAAGVAVTLLNWRGEAVPALQVDIDLDFKPDSVAAVKAGQLPFTVTPTGIHCTLPVAAADIIVIPRPQP